MKDLPEALALVLDGLAPLGAETIPLVEAAERVMASEAHAAIDLPPFDRTAMDGYAVRAADIAPGVVAARGRRCRRGRRRWSPSRPARPRASPPARPIPPGADSILRVEDAEVRDGTVVAGAVVRNGLHVRRRGEDLHAGDVLARPGDVLTLPRLSALASAGVASVGVHRAPRLHVFVTGDELLPPGAPPEPGKIYESNGLLVSLMAARAGAVVTRGDQVGDDAEATRAAVEAGLSADVLVVSGGVSVGPHDHVKPAFDACGVEEVFWRVQIKPGKPLWFGRRGSTLVFGLPGNPLSAIVGTAVFVVPALRRLRGEAGAGPRLRPRPTRRSRRAV